MTPNGELAIVTWNDASDFDETWADDGAVAAFGDKPCPIVSVGWIVRKTPLYITIAADWDDSSKNWGRICKIPTGMVLDTKLINMV